MFQHFRLHRLKKWSPLLIFLFLAVWGGYYFWGYIFNSALPPEFLKARQRVVEISGQLVDLTSNTNYKIKDINSLDDDGHYAAGLSLVNRARDENKKAFDQAVDLSNQLKIMTEALPKIRSLEGRQFSQEAVSLELALIVHFINYTKAMDDLLLVINNKLITPNKKYQREIDIKLSDINAQALLINNLNEEFYNKMAELDRLLK